MEQFKLDATGQMAHLDESLKSAHKRIDNLEKLTNSVYELAASIKTMQHDMTDMTGRLRTIEEKPAKRWDLAITTVITTVIGVVVGFLLKL